jgi:hypothetical protein
MVIDISIDTVQRVINERVRAFDRNPMELEAVLEGLSSASNDEAKAMLEEAFWIERARLTNDMWCVKLINIVAARRYFREKGSEKANQPAS